MHFFLWAFFDRYCWSKHLENENMKYEIKGQAADGHLCVDSKQ